jgi:hypothetical protein
MRLSALLLAATAAFRVNAIARDQGSSTTKPTPQLRVVAVVGCVTAEGNDWYLTQATGPITVPTADGRGETGSGVTFAKAKSAPPGTQRYRLMNMLAELGVPQHKGQRVLAKGLLLGDQKDRRINLVAVEEIAPTCSGTSH